MVITLDGNRVLVDIDGSRVTTFDPAGKDVPRRGEWHEPSCEPSARPQATLACRRTTRDMTTSRKSASARWRGGNDPGLVPLRLRGHVCRDQN